MTANELRNSFINFFRDRDHKIYPSAPLVIKNDPTLMFTNAGMNQFKDIFLGNTGTAYKRVANTQKCLRVSGKHNDLEEVGHDTYHHTMFEMLGNWSFGDYFKKEAIDWAWIYLTDVLGIEKDRLYATVFEGSKKENIDMDNESFECWRSHLTEDRILKGNKEDNFWEMGYTGPCGPCSEIHIDLRDDNERKKIPGYKLVNTGNPQVIEIWNLVFIQFNRKNNGELERLPERHVDTGMGFERLCRVVQNKTSNYDTDIFQPVIQKLSDITRITYGSVEETDVAMRVVADHLRAISFSIADGQLPSNTGAGYVIRRILRRAVRYGFTFLKMYEPFMYELVEVLIKNMGESYPELISQKELIISVIREEEASFLRTLETGTRLLDQYIDKAKVMKSSGISGKDAFILYDTYGFPLDLTELILREHHLTVSQEDFNREMEQQRKRSQSDAQKDTGDWHVLLEDSPGEFTGYDKLEDEIMISRYRKINHKGKEYWQLVFNTTPFYAESGGQIGDSGYIDNSGVKTRIIDTIKENNLSIHIVEKLPGNISSAFHAVVDGGTRIDTANNHTSTHLLHFALRKVLGKHVEQKGSLVHPDYLRFDFSHFQKLSDTELREIEKTVNDLIRQNLPVEDLRSIPIEEAKKMGAIALFGEKYGDSVRVIRFGDSIELCGGTHVRSTGQIGFFMITKESAIAAGIRRIEAISGTKCAEHIFKLRDTLKNIQQILPLKLEPLTAVEKILQENSVLRTQTESIKKEMLGNISKKIKSELKTLAGINYIITRVENLDTDEIKELSYRLRGEISDLLLVIGSETNGKANLSIMISDELVTNMKFNAVDIIREISKEIQGGGGGQPFYATAGGKNPAGLDAALKKAEVFLKERMGGGI